MRIEKWQSKPTVPPRRQRWFFEVIKNGGGGGSGSGVVGGWRGLFLSFGTGFAVSSFLYRTSNRGSSTAMTTSTRQPTQRSDTSGWKTIDVFYGQYEEDRIQRMPGKSQCDQDQLVMALLEQKHHGYFLDLAANDAVPLSNTFALETIYNWTGICVEPNPKYWEALVYYRRCHVAAAVVGSTRMEPVSFWMMDGPRSPSAGILGFDNTLDNNIHNHKRAGREMKFYTVPIGEILDRYNAPAILDYVSLDVEGAEYFVMKDFPFDRYAFRILTIERPKQELVNLLYRHSYLYLAANNEHGMETLFVHKHHYLLEYNLQPLQQLPQQQKQTSSRIFTTNDDDRIQRAVESVGWRFGTTKWLQVGTTTNDPPTVIGTK